MGKAIIREALSPIGLYRVEVQVDNSINNKIQALNGRIAIIDSILDSELIKPAEEQNKEFIGRLKIDKENLQKQIDKYEAYMYEV